MINYKHKRRYYDDFQDQLLRILVTNWYYHELEIVGDL